MKPHDDLFQFNFIINTFSILFEFIIDDYFLFKLKQFITIFIF